MSNRMLQCPRCGRVTQPGAAYCPFCGEAVDPALVAELQWLYGALNDLDTRIARGEGDQTITALRDEYRERYLLSRRAPAPAASSASTSATSTSASAQPSPAPAATSAPTASSTPQSASTPAAPSAPSIAPQPRHEGPVFSWQAFLSEQAIAIMMYMGGFLGLVAMLSFEIGGWQSLDLRIKLGAIIVVYVAFGALGLIMRRRPRLHTVGGAYLGVFALMTPLLALGIYRFGLQAAGFSGSAMLCLSAAYAAIVYLALAWRTRFVTYAYLGWSALVLSALAAVSWADAPAEAVIFALAFVSLLLLLPSLFRLLSFAELLETPALQLAAVTSLAAAGGALFLGLALATRAIDETPLAVSASPPPHYSTAVFALASCALVLVACAWSYLARGLTREQEADVRAGRLNVVDWLIVAAVTQAVIAVAAWAGADRRAMAVVLSTLALSEAAALFILWRRARERTELRYLVETLALGLAIIACLGVASDPAPNWPYLLALTSGLVVTGGLAIFETTPLWLLPAGVFLSLDYYTLLDTLFHQSLATVGAEYEIPIRALVATLLVLVMVVPWQVARPTLLMRRFAAPVYLIALGNALYATINLFRQDAFYATLILGLFVTLALVAGWRSRYPLIGGLVGAFFGFFLPLPLSVAGGAPRFVLGAAIAAVVVGLLALGARALLGRASALAAYLVALWMAVVVAFRLLINPNFPTDWRFLGYSLPVGLLLTFALLAMVAILWENAPWAMFIPAFFGLVAVFVTPGIADVQGLALAVALAVVGIALRWFRGRWTWSIAWYIAALLAALLQILLQGIRLDSEGLNWRVLVGPLFMLLAYLAAATERQPWMTSVVPFFALGATFFFPTLQDFVPTLVMVYGMVLAGLALRLFFRRRWAVACYVAAIAPSLLAVWRAVPPTAGEHEALLLIFALTAYGIALIEREPAFGAVAAVYAGLAPLVQLNGRPLLGLTLAMVAVGVVISRIGGWRWAWPAYTAALAAGLVTALVGYREPTFEAWALLALAVAAYLVAMIESQVEALTLALVVGALALLAADRALELAYWQTALSLIALSWLYTLGQWLWGALPWLRNRISPPWWDPDAQADTQALAHWRDTRRLGRMIHHAAGLLLGTGVAAGLALATDTYMPGAGLAQVEVVALISLGLLLALSAWALRLHALWYVAGGLIAIALSWQMRWFGADNIQAFVLAPGSYLLLVGALLPADRRVQNPLRAGQMASLLGALLLLLPTLMQSFTTGQSENWIYASALALEALVIAAIGVGAHARVLLLLGTGFFGLAAIRGALLAFSSGVPVALIIAALALLLMGGATWLSLRGRREAGADLTS